MTQNPDKTLELFRLTRLAIVNVQGRDPDVAVCGVEFARDFAKALESVHTQSFHEIFHSMSTVGIQYEGVTVKISDEMSAQQCLIGYRIRTDD